jgi:hypothetical protein
LFHFSRSNLLWSKRGISRHLVENWPQGSISLSRRSVGQKGFSRAGVQWKPDGRPTSDTLIRVWAFPNGDFTVTLLVKCIVPDSLYHTDNVKRPLLSYIPPLRGDMIRFVSCQPFSLSLSLSFSLGFRLPIFYFFLERKDRKE